MTVYLDNPAGRLHKVLQSFRHAAGNQSEMGVPQHQTIAHAWAKALKVSSIDEPALLRQLAHVFQLPDDIKREIAEVDDEQFDSDFALRWQGWLMPQLAPALFSGVQASTVAGQMHEAALSSLEQCSYVLHRHRPQLVIPEAHLVNIWGLITDLGEEIDADDKMDQGLRDFLLSQVNVMIRAVSAVELRGSVTLEEAFDQAMGAVMRRTDLTVRIADNKSVWTKFGVIIATVASALSITVTSLALPGDLRQAIDGPPAEQPVVVQVEMPPDGVMVSEVHHSAKAAQGHSAG